MKRIISRFEYILNTYLREFVRISIEDWVSFIKSFTVPKYELGEMWKISTTPLIVVHLTFKIKEKDDKKKKKTTKKKDQAADKEEDEGNKINYHPKLEKCQAFIKSALNMIVTSTNKVSNLEVDLMPFLQKEKIPNFPISDDFPWVQDAKQKLEAMFSENVTGPLELLEKYK